MFEIQPKLEEYIVNHIDEEDDLLKELNRETNLKIFHPRQLSGHLQGKILEMLTKMLRPDRILEIGTFTGYSALCMAKGLSEGGEIHTIEINDELEDFTQGFFNRSEYRQQIKLHIGDALKIIPTLKGNFDLIFIDGNKSHYIEYYEMVLPKMDSGAYIIADNILWDGKVLHSDIRNNDHFARGIISFNKHIKNDQRVEKVILPIRDGMTLIRKK